MNASIDVQGAAQAAPAPTGHSRLGASGSDRWMNCPGSVRAEAAAVAENPGLAKSSVYAEEGTACHSVAALCLESGQDAIEYAGRTVDSVEIDGTEHCEGVQLYLDTIRADKEARGGKLLIETRFHLADLHPDFFGTCDCARLGTDGILSVYDLKMGRGKIVEVSKGDKPNSQLGYYALGAIDALQRVIESVGGLKGIELVVVQPRAPHPDGRVRRATFTVAEIVDLGAVLTAAAKLTEAPDAPFAAGDHCGFCKAAGICPTLRQVALDTAQLDFDDDKGIVAPWGETTVNPLTLTNEQLANVLEAADVIESWISAVRFHATITLNTGKSVPGWKMVARQGRRAWDDEEKAAGELQLVYGLDETSIFVKKLKSPNQVDKLLPKPEREQLKSSNLYSAKSSGTILVREDDKRPEATPTVQADFDDGLSEPVEW